MNVLIFVIILIIEDKIEINEFKKSVIVFNLEENI